MSHICYQFGVSQKCVRNTFLSSDCICMNRTYCVHIELENTIVSTIRLITKFITYSYSG